jgi:hypothetical protein
MLRRVEWRTVPDVSTEPSKVSFGVKQSFGQRDTTILRNFGNCLPVEAP